MEKKLEVFLRRGELDVVPWHSASPGQVRQVRARHQVIGDVTGAVGLRQPGSRAVAG